MKKSENSYFSDDPALWRYKVDWIGAVARNLAFDLQKYVREKVSAAIQEDVGLDLAR
jgi:hypothetical protein